MRTCEALLWDLLARSANAALLPPRGERAAWPSVGFGELLLPCEWARRGSGKPEQLS